MARFSARITNRRDIKTATATLSFSLPKLLDVCFTAGQEVEITYEKEKLTIVPKYRDEEHRIECLKAIQKLNRQRKMVKERNTRVKDITEPLEPLPNMLDEETRIRLFGEPKRIVKSNKPKKLTEIKRKTKAKKKALKKPKITTIDNTKEVKSSLDYGE